MLSPLLIIGIGGSGGKTIRSMKQALLRQFAAHRYMDGIPQAWQFLQIDTTYDGVDFPAPMLPMSEVHLVVGEDETFADVRGNLESKGATRAHQQELLSGWAIPSSGVKIKDGAGQMRGIGRQVGVNDASGIANALRTAVGRMMSPTANAELARMAEAIGSAGTVDAQPRVVFIASLAGGSGAGMFIDVAEILKRTISDSFASEAISFLYTAEVFESLGEAGADVRKNSLGAMNEIIAGKWGPITDRTVTFYDSLALPNRPGTQDFGCKGNILIGARNSKNADLTKEASGAGMDEVFLTIGEALAGVYTDAAIVEFLYKRAFVNITQSKKTVDSSGLAPEVAGYDTLPFAGIGFGRLTLGADRVVDYVADAMTRKQVDLLLWPTTAYDQLKDGVRAQDLLEAKVDELWPNFLKASGLNERGNDDQVLDELWPDARKSKIETFATTIVKTGITEKPQDLQKVTKKIWSEWESNSEEFLNGLHGELRSKAVAWRSNIQTQISDLVAQTVAQYGYQVATTLLMKLEDEILKHGSADLKREAEESGKFARAMSADAWSQQVIKAAEGRTGLSKADGPVWSKLSSAIQTIAHRKLETQTKNLAADLLIDIVPRFLVPLRESLASSFVILDRDAKALVLEDGRSNPLKWFPEWGSGKVPPRYKPRAVERTLIDPSQFETIYTDYAGREAGVDNPFATSYAKALLGLSLVPPLGKTEEQGLLTLVEPWIPSVSDAQQMGEPATKAQFTVNADLLELGNRNRVWLKNPNSNFGRVSDMSIREYVAADGNAAEQSRREDQFATAYQEMMGLAQPLVKLNSGAMKFISGVDGGKPAVGVMVESSKIPFAPTSRAGQKCATVLEQLGYDSSDNAFNTRWFDGSSPDRELYAASTSQASLPAWAFESLTDPIAKQVAVAKAQQGLWNQFWQGRRARPLPEAVPFSPEIRKSIVTGWFLARWFNLVETPEVAVGKTAQIWNPNLTVPGWSKFPNPLLPSSLADNRNNWLLPSILTSAGLAFVELGQSGSLEPIHAYHLLKYLGREVTTEIPSRDQWDGEGIGDLLPNGLVGRSKIIQEWIHYGKTPGPNQPIQELGDANLSALERQELMVKLAAKVQGEYAEIWNRLNTVEWPEIPHMWELKDDIATALSDIHLFTGNLVTQAGSSPLG